MFKSDVSPFTLILEIASFKFYRKISISSSPAAEALHNSHLGHDVFHLTTSDAMPCCTVFICDRVEFSAVESVNENQTTNWEPAQVSVTEITNNRRWLMVVLQRERIPVVWRVLTDGWTLACDESEMTCIQRPTASAMTQGVEKLRFSTRRDFWTFTAHLMHGRVLGHRETSWTQAGSGRSSDGGSNSGSS
ncbi:hypothetical protein ONZ51_g7825 [Trametes cubensis]|uniref:Uncharacterized protein n=1 Tax=Trametes cubensis TaxID=1111947 RepID=A0AAD7TPS2_9APHY|nr:hypothetical protein ONZ51_g7825 [Trametes cubensis]